MIGSENFESKSGLITRRMFILSFAKITVFIAIVARLFYLQISENIKYRSLSDKNRLREWKVAPKRGVIEDYFGKKLGGFLLSEAIKKSFLTGVKRVWVHTCSLDHKNALKNYLSRGMTIFKSEILKREIA